ncbi:MAG: Glycosyltransferase involved in cell wall bisynthesis [Candidatus Nitrotoga sp. LAW]|nr:glycosyltransferase family 4 protein [Candidatus Nitrotoga sp.]RFC38039.1 MAG: Glycosyltransferase involved in cell wall bisynthesis [Candidatus Nitrotoga sp. LAW]
MPRLLVIAYSFPQPDEASGELRFFTLLSLLASKHKVLFCALSENGTTQPRNQASAQLEQAGITLGEVGLPHVLRHFKPDIVWFEFYHQARSDYLGLLERYCPQARLMVDSVDVHFNRLETRARLTGKTEDAAAARQMKAQELTAYASADMVIAVSNDDRQLILQELPQMRVEVVPNIHTVPSFPDRGKRHHGELLFVGGFKHDPNIDAMLYFCQEILPRIITTHPQTRLKIIGSNVPQAIQALASEHVDVLGYVPVTAPHLQSAYISVAPLRYGGGMKGKVGEAMSYGLPVVTTSFGAEGFGLQPDEDLLIGNDAETFAAQVIALLDDTELHDRVARRGYDFIKQHYSVPAVEQLLDSAMQGLLHVPPRKIPLHRKLKLGIKGWYMRNIAWRFTQA